MTDEPIENTDEVTEDETPIQDMLVSELTAEQLASLLTPQQLVEFGNKRQGPTIVKMEQGIVDIVNRLVEMRGLVAKFGAAFQRVAAEPMNTDETKLAILTSARAGLDNLIMPELRGFQTDMEALTRLPHEIEVAEDTVEGEQAPPDDTGDVTATP